MKAAPLKTIEIGALPTGEVVRQLEDSGYVSSYAQELIEKMPQERIETIDLVKMTVQDLGFTKPAEWKDILSKAQELGYDLCPPEAGPMLRLAWDDQPKGTWAYIGMEPIAGSGGGPDVFYVGRRGDGKSWLRADWVSPDNEWRLDDEVVFRLRKGTKKLGTKSLSLDPLPLVLEINGIKYKRI